MPNDMPKYWVTVNSKDGRTAQKEYSEEGLKKVWGTLQSMGDVTVGRIDPVTIDNIADDEEYSVMAVDGNGRQAQKTYTGAWLRANSGRLDEAVGASGSWQIAPTLTRMQPRYNPEDSTLVGFDEFQGNEITPGQIVMSQATQELDDAEQDFGAKYNELEKQYGQLYDQLYAMPALMRATQEGQLMEEELNQLAAQMDEIKRKRDSAANRVNDLSAMEQERAKNEEIANTPDEDGKTAQQRLDEFNEEYGDEIDKLNSYLDASPAQFDNAGNDERFRFLKTYKTKGVDPHDRYKKLTAERKELEKARDDSPQFKAAKRNIEINNEYLFSIADELGRKYEYQGSTDDLGMRFAVNKETGANSDYEMGLIRAANDLMTDTYRTQKIDRNNMIGGAQSYLGSTDLVSGGVTTIQRNANLLKLFKKIATLSEDDKTDLRSSLSDEENLLLDAFNNNIDMHQLVDPTRGAGFQAGEAAAQSAVFMAQMMVTGGLINESSLPKVTEKLTERLLKKGVTSAGKKYAAEMGAKAIMSIPTAGAETMLNIPMLVKSYSNEAIKYHDGELPSFWRAAGNALLDTGIEVWTERFGEPLEAVLNLPFKGIGMGVKKMLPGFYKDAGRFFSMMGETSMAKFLRQSGLNGIVGEMAEEVLGDAARTVTGYDHDALRNNLTWDNQLTTFLSFLPTMLGGGAVSMAQVKSGQARYARTRDNLMAQLAGEGMGKDAIKSAIDGINTNPIEGRRALREMLNLSAAFSGTQSPLQTDVRGKNKLSDAIDKFALASQWKASVEGVWASQQVDDKARMIDDLEKQFGGRITVDGQDRSETEDENTDEDIAAIAEAENEEEEGSETKKETKGQRRRRVLDEKEKRDKKKRAKYDRLQERFDGEHVSIIYDKKGKAYFALGAAVNGQIPVRAIDGNDHTSTFLNEDQVATGQTQAVEDGKKVIRQMTAAEQIEKSKVSLNQYLTRQLIFNENERRKAVGRNIRQQMISGAVESGDFEAGGEHETFYNPKTGHYYKVEGQQVSPEAGLQVTEYEGGKLDEETGQWTGGHQVGETQMMEWDDVWKYAYGEELINDNNAVEQTKAMEDKESEKKEAKQERSEGITQLAATLKIGDAITLEGRRLKIADVQDGLYVLTDESGNPALDANGEEMRLNAEQLYDRGVRDKDRSVDVPQNGTSTGEKKAPTPDEAYDSLVESAVKKGRSEATAAALIQGRIAKKKEAVKDAKKAVSEAEKAVKAAEGKEVQYTGDDDADLDAEGQKEDEIKAANKVLDQAKVTLANAEADLDFWQQVADTPKRRAEAKKKAEETKEESPVEETKTETKEESKEESAPTTEEKTEEQKEAENKEEDEKRKAREKKNREVTQKKKEETKKKNALNEHIGKLKETFGGSIEITVLNNLRDLKKVLQDVGAEYTSGDEKITFAFADPANMKAYFYAPAIVAGSKNEKEVIKLVNQKFAHEVLSHIGMKKLMDNYAATHDDAKYKSFNDFCSKVFGMMDKANQDHYLHYHWAYNLTQDQRKKAATKAGFKGKTAEKISTTAWENLSDEQRTAILEADRKAVEGTNTASMEQAAADEYCAHLSERTLNNEKFNEGEKNLWQKIVDAIKKAFHIEDENKGMFEGSEDELANMIAEALNDSARHLSGREAASKAKEESKTETSKEETPSEGNVLQEPAAEYGEKKESKPKAKKPAKLEDSLKKRSRRNQLLSKVFDAAGEAEQQKMLSNLWDNHISEDQRRVYLTAAGVANDNHYEWMRWELLPDSVKQKILDSNDKKLTDLQLKAKKDRTNADAFKTAAGLYSDKNKSNEAEARRKKAGEADEIAKKSREAADSYVTLKMGAADEYYTGLAEKVLGDTLEDSDKTAWQTFADTAKGLFGTDEATDDKAIANALTESGKSLRKSVDETALDAAEAEGNGDPVRFSRKITDPAEFPKTTGKAYKVFWLNKKGLHSTMVNRSDVVEPGAWYKAESAELHRDKSTEKNPRVKAKNNMALALRPGYHFSDKPVGPQFNVLNRETGEKELQRWDYIVAECEYDAGRDYAEEAHQAGIHPNGNFVAQDAYLRILPENGFYRYTQKVSGAEEWILSDKMRVAHVLTDEEVDELCRKNGWEIPKRQPCTEEQMRWKNETIAALNNEIGNRQSEGSSLGERIKAAGEQTDPNPTEAQKEAGNYKMGHVKVGPYEISIENAEGSTRSGTDANGKKWSTKMKNAYGYFKGTEGVDGDHIDVFLSNDIDNWDGDSVFVVDQYNPDGTFDEHKVMLGFNSQDEAKAAYLANYDKGWENGRRLDITQSDMDGFNKWVESSHRKTKPFADYKSANGGTVRFSDDEKSEKSHGRFEKNPHISHEYVGWEKRNIKINTDDYEQTDEFRGIQEESRGSNTAPEYWRGLKNASKDGSGRRIAGIFGRQLDAARSSLGDVYEVLTDKVGEYKIHKNVSGKLFHDFFEIARKYLPNGELVDLHEDYSDSICYLTEDGMAGFAINQETGNLVSVFNLRDRKGFLHSIRDYIVKEGATHLDAYASKKQNLREIYEKCLGARVASSMDYNMEYDHDDIAKNHGEPPVVWMALPNENGEYPKDAEGNDIEEIHFNKDQYNDAEGHALDYFRGANNVRKSVVDEKSEKSLGWEENNADIRSRKNNTRENGTETADERNGVVGQSTTHSKSEMGQLRSGVYVSGKRGVEQGIQGRTDTGRGDGNGGKEPLEQRASDEQIKSELKKHGIEDVTPPDWEGSGVRFCKVRFSKGKAALIATHTITLENIYRFLRLGGMASPSIAVINLMNGLSETGWYGDYMFVLNPKLVSYIFGEHNGTSVVDIWGPMMPKIHESFSEEGQKKFNEDIKSYPQEIQDYVRATMGDYMTSENLSHCHGLAYMFLATHKNEYKDSPAVSWKEDGTPDYKATGDNAMDFVTGNGLESKLLEWVDGLYKRYGITADAIQSWRNQWRNHNPAKKKEIELTKKRYQAERRGDEAEYNRLDAEIKALRDARKDFNLDGGFSLAKVAQDMADQRARRFNAWFIDKKGEPDGNFFDMFVGLTAPVIMDRAGLYERSDQLTGNYDGWDKFKADWTNDERTGKFNRLLDAVSSRPDKEGRPAPPYTLKRLVEAMRDDNPAQFIKDKYGIKLSEEDKNNLNDLKLAINSNQLKSPYAELWMNKTVNLKDFMAIVVPNDAPESLVVTLEKARLKVVKYTKGNMGERLEALKKVVEENNLYIDSKATAMDDAKELGVTLTPADVAKVSSASATRKMAVKRATEGGRMPQMDSRQELTFYIGEFSKAPMEVKNEVLKQAMARNLDIAKAMAEKIAAIAVNETVYNAKLSNAERNVLDNAVNAIADELGIDTDQAKYVLWNHVWNGNDMVTNGMRTVMQNKCNLNTVNSERAAKKTSQMRSSRADRTAISSAHDYYERAMGSVRGALREQVQDEYRALEELVKAVAGQTGHPLASWEDPAYAFNQLTSKTMAGMRKYLYERLTPMWKAISDMCRDYNLKEEDIVRYVSLKHGLERNEVLYDRDLKEAQNAQKNDPAVQLPEQRDYSGLTTWFKQDDGSELSLEEMTAAAQQEVADFEKMVGKAANGLWDKINTATNASLRIQLQSGLISREIYDRISKMFKNYIPLQGFADTTNEDLYTYFGSRDKRKTGLSNKKAEGRTSIAADPFGTIAAQAQNAIIQGEKNMAKYRLYMFLNSRRDNDLVTLGDVWYTMDGKDENNNPIWKVAAPNLTPDMTSEQADKVIKDWEADMRKQEKAGTAKRDKDRFSVPGAVFTYPSDVNQHCIDVYVNGSMRRIYIKGNPRAAQAVNGQIEGDPMIGGKLLNAVQKGTRYLSEVYTSYSPEFFITNFMRDMQFAATNIYAKEDGAYTKLYGQNLKKAFGIGSLEKKYRNGTLDVSNPIERLYKEFAENGSITGYSKVSSNSEYEDMLSDFLHDEMHPSVKAAFSGMLERFERLTSNGENLARFATYMTSRQMGRSMEESTANAKDVTVNFNRRGTGFVIGKEEAKKLIPGDDTKSAFKRFWLRLASACMGFRPFYAFYNVSVQSIAQVLNNAVEHPKKMAAVFGGYLAMGFVNGVLHGALDALFGSEPPDVDDWYWNLPDYVRRNNTIIPLGGGRYIKIALPQELRPFYGLGDLVATGLAHKMAGKNIALEFGKMLADTLPVNPVGESGLQGVAPTVIAPFTDILLNKDYRGMQVTPTYYNEASPKWRQARSGTADWAVQIARGLNRIGGDDDVASDVLGGTFNWSPEALQHVVEGYLGGTFTFANRIAKTAKGLIDPEEKVEARNIPLLNRAYGQASDQSVGAYQKDCYDYAKKVHDRFKTKQTNTIKRQDFDKLDGLYDGRDFEIWQLFEEYQGVIKAYQNLMGMAEDRDEKEAYRETRNGYYSDLANELEMILYGE